MTTDVAKKEVAVEFTLGGKTCAIGGIAKGSGMIHPNMATMLVFMTTDAAISAEMLQKAIRADVTDTFNMVSVDGDTSTNDTLAILANGMAEERTNYRRGRGLRGLLRSAARSDLLPVPDDCGRRRGSNQAAHRLGVWRRR